MLAEGGLFKVDTKKGKYKPKMVPIHSPLLASFYLIRHSLLHIKIDRL